LDYNIGLSSIGNIHALFTLFSLFSKRISNSPIIDKYIKQELLLKIVKLTKNFFISIFSYELISPILNALEWNIQEFTPEIEEILASYGQQFRSHISKWDVLDDGIQKNLALSTFSRHLVLDILSKSVLSI